MRKFHMSGVEHVHMMRKVPRSYDMTRTHIMHRSVNKHVDVVLRSAPKNWKKKKVPVTLVRSEKKKQVVQIRAHAGKGYVAVRKVTNEKYEADRRKVVTAYETRYGKPSAGNRALVHDMRSQLSTMAQRSADYIDGQLMPSPSSQPVKARPQNTAPLPAFPEVPEKTGDSLLSPEVEAILKQGGYKRPHSSAPTNPYASDYLKQTSDTEFRSLMASLEKSLDAACDRYVTQPAPQPEPQPEASPAAQPEPARSADDPWYVPKSAQPSPDFDVSVTEQRELYAPPAEEAPLEEFAPALDFRQGGEHYVPQDELFDRDFTAPEYDDMAAEDDVMPLPAEEKSSFDVSRYFSDEEFDEPAPAGYQEEDFPMPARFAPEEDSPYYYDDGDNISPGNFDAADDGYAPPQPAPEGDYAYPDDGGREGGDDGYFGQPDEYFGEEDAPFAPMPDYGEEEEDAPPPMLFPDGDEYEQPPQEQWQGEAPYEGQEQWQDEGYSPAPVSPDRNEYWTGDGGGEGNAQPAETRQSETFFSRAGGQLRKAIGVIRGSARSKEEDEIRHGSGNYSQNGDVEITFSDHNQ